MEEKLGIKGEGREDGGNTDEERETTEIGRGGGKKECVQVERRERGGRCSNERAGGEEGGGRCTGVREGGEEDGSEVGKWRDETLERGRERGGSVLEGGDGRFVWKGERDGLFLRGKGKKVVICKGIGKVRRSGGGGGRRRRRSKGLSNLQRRGGGRNGEG